MYIGVNPSELDVSLDSINHMITIQATRCTIYDREEEEKKMGIQPPTNLLFTPIISTTATTNQTHKPISCKRQIIMPIDAAIEMTQGKYTQGVLHLTIPKIIPINTTNNKLSITVCPKEDIMVSNSKF